MPSSEQLELTIELGRAAISRDEVSSLAAGTVVVLDKLAADPVDVLVEGRLVARGELVEVDGNLCVRVTELLAARMAA